MMKVGQIVIGLLMATLSALQGISLGAVLGLKSDVSALIAHKDDQDRRINEIRQDFNKHRDRSELYWRVLKSKEVVSEKDLKVIGKSYDTNVN